MLTTEEKSNNKLCHANFNTCHASECMAWRWADPINQPRRAFVYAVGDYERIPPEPADRWVYVSDEDNDGDGALWRETDEYMNKRRVGFCGLAGVPL